MDINIKRDSINSNRFNIEGIEEFGEKKGIAGFHGGFINRVIGWISCYILHKSVPVESKNKGIYYLNCKSLENFQKRIRAEPPENVHNQKDVEAWLQQVKNKSVNPEERPQETTKSEEARITIPTGGQKQKSEIDVTNTQPTVQKESENEIDPPSQPFTRVIYNVLLRKDVNKETDIQILRKNLDHVQDIIYQCRQGSAYKGFPGMNDAINTLENLLKRIEEHPDETTPLDVENLISKLRVLKNLEKHFGDYAVHRNETQNVNFEFGGEQVTVTLPEWKEIFLDSFLKRLDNRINRINEAIENS